MEAPEDYVTVSHSSSSTGECPNPTVMKRKRTKRQRALSSPPLPAAASSSTSSMEISATTEEEEDMAHCLILLAQGRALDSPPPGGSGGTEKFTSRRFTETTTTAGGKAGFYVYECKTCNKCFPSFQALGGHRASHKKPKMPIPTIGTTEDHKKQLLNDNMLDGLDISINTFSKPDAAAIVPVAAANSPTGNNNNNKLRVHECSICGAEFSSGQALGGHMRRHRPIGASPELQETKKDRNVLSLDLNLPAPPDENSSELEKKPLPPPVTTFSFADKRPMVFSTTSALVDCHY